MAKLNKLMADSSSQNKSIGYTYGKVVSYNSDTCKAVIELNEYNNAQKTFLNKSGEKLSIGDNVWIYYRGGGINCGYIALRNGLPDPIGMGVGRFTNEEKTSERFNDYTTTIFTNLIEGTEYKEQNNTIRGCNDQIYIKPINGRAYSGAEFMLNNIYISGSYNRMDFYPNSGDSQPYYVDVVGNQNNITFNDLTYTSIIGNSNDINAKECYQTYILGGGNVIKEDNSPQLNTFHWDIILGYGNSLDFINVINPYQYNNEGHHYKNTICGVENEVRYRHPYDKDKGIGIFSGNSILGYSNQFFYDCSYFEDNTIVGHNIKYDADIKANKFDSNNYYRTQWFSNVITGCDTEFNNPISLSYNAINANDLHVYSKTNVSRYSHIQHTLIETTEASIYLYNDSNYPTSLLDSTVLGHGLTLNIKSYTDNLLICGNNIQLVSSNNRDLFDLSLIGNGISFNQDNFPYPTKIGTVIGCGTLGKETYIDDNGNLSLSGTISTQGQDYAEFWEWADRNASNEDRRGLFVTSVGDRIRLANKGEKILGIVSANPSVIGNGDCYAWKNKYLRDVFGSFVYEDIQEPIIKSERRLKKEPYTDDNGVYHEAEYENIQVETGEYRTVKKPVINPKYDETQAYIPRSERSEYCCVGHLGRLVMIDDGSCEVNGYATSADKGIATKSETETRARVLKRIDNNHILVWWE